MSESPDFGKGIEPAIEVLLLYSLAFPIPFALFCPKFPVKAPVLDLNFSLFADSFLRSNLRRPTKFMVSVSKFVLIFISSGASVAKLGLKLTSRTQGFKSESIKMSKPKTSKQLSRYILFLRIA